MKTLCKTTFFVVITVISQLGMAASCCITGNSTKDKDIALRPYRREANCKCIQHTAYCCCCLLGPTNCGIVGCYQWGCYKTAVCCAAVSFLALSKDIVASIKTCQNDHNNLNASYERQKAAADGKPFCFGAVRVEWLCNRHTLCIAVTNGAAGKGISYKGTPDDPTHKVTFATHKPADESV